MSPSIERAVMALGWLAQIASFTLALRRVGALAAAPGEWLREAVLRVSFLVLLVCAFAAPSLDWVRIAAAVRALLLALFLAGHALALTGRARLGAAWGIGTGPVTPGRTVVEGGVFRAVRHPIYAGTNVVIMAQLALMQNWPSLLLVALSAIVTPAKIIRENRWIRERAAGA